MNRSRRLSQPLYESLPGLYVLGGLVALVASYFVAFLHVVSLVLGLGGLGAVIGGVVVWLRRRDYRQLRANYSDPDFLGREFGCTGTTPPPRASFSAEPLTGKNEE